MSVRDLKRAKYDAETARKRFEARLIEIQERLQPASLTSNAWEGVKEKGTEIAGDAVQAVKDRPVAVSAGLAAFTLFLARGPIKSGLSRWFSGREDDDRDRAKEKHKPAASPAARTKDEGVTV